MDDYFYVRCGIEALYAFCLAVASGSPFCVFHAGMAYTPPLQPGEGI
jgi:hypothetical protein